MEFNIIVAVDKNGVIGLDNKIPWKCKRELELFKQITLNNPILMGRKTAESIGRVLPNRLNYVVSKSLSKPLYEGQVLLKDCVEVFNLNHEKIFIIGGEEIYRYFFNFSDNIYISTMDIECEKGDTFFPYLDKINDLFSLEAEKLFEPTTNKDLGFIHRHYKKNV